MANNQLSKVSNQVIAGVIMIGLGVLFLLDNLGLFSMRHAMHFWPLILIIVGTIKILQQPDARGARIGGILIVIGVVLFAGKLGLFQLTMRLLFPCILIAVGIMILTRPDRQKRHKQDVQQDQQSQPAPPTWQTGAPAATVSLDKDGGFARAGSSHDEAPLDITAVLGAYQRSVNTKNFRGGDVTAILGGCELDLRQASFQGEVVINVVVIMGGIAIKVPSDWTVILQGTPVLGGFDERTTAPANGDKRLILRGTAVMGGVEVRN